MPTDIQFTVIHIHQNDLQILSCVKLVPEDVCHFSLKKEKEKKKTQKINPIFECLLYFFMGQQTD